MSRNSVLWACGFVVAACASPPQWASEDEVSALEPAVLRGDPVAIDAMFVMRRRADGAVAECISDTLGQTIRVSPEVFLELLAKHRYGHLDALVGCMFELVDDLPAQEQERRRRIAALQSVTRPDLAVVRELCIAVLRDQSR